MTAPAFTRRSWFWFVAFTIWFIVLWFLSSHPTPKPKDGLEIPHLDKFLHFGYYLGGSGLLSAALYLLPRRPRLGWDAIHLLAIVAVTVTGILDEWHQSWYPFRTGNNSADLGADFLGAVTGTLLFRRWRHWVEDPR